MNRTDLDSALAELAAANCGDSLDAARRFFIGDDYGRMPSGDRQQLDSAWREAHGRWLRPSQPANKPTAASIPPGKRFLDAFGDQGGVWFAQGKTFEQASELHYAAAVAENARLKKEVNELKTFSELRPALGDNVARFAASIELPSENNPGNSVTPERVRQLQNSCGSEGLAKFAAGIELPGESA